MTPLEALLELLERIESGGDGTAVVSEAELSHWPAEAVRELRTQRLLVKASPAVSVVCPGCEQECTMPLHNVSSGVGKTALFVVCNKRDDINRVAVSAERAKQWRCGVDAVGAFVAQSLGLRAGVQRKADAGLWELGIVQGKKRSQMVCLRASTALELVAGQNAVPVAELVRFVAEGYSVDDEAIRQLVDAASTGDSRYTPSNARRETRKLETQARHKRWRKAFQTLKRSRPGRSGVWYSQQIAKLDVADGCSAETIRKNIK